MHVYWLDRREGWPTRGAGQVLAGFFLLRALPDGWTAQILAEKRLLTRRPRTARLEATWALKPWVLQARLVSCCLCFRSPGATLMPVMHSKPSLHCSGC